MANAWRNTFAALAGGLVAVALLSVEACGSSGDVEAGERPDTAVVETSASDAQATPFNEPAMLAAAAAFNAKYCGGFKTCDPEVFGVTFGTMERCLAARGLVAIAAGDVRYVDDLAAPYANGSLLTPDGLVACAAALNLTDCDAWVHFTVEHEVPPSCKSAAVGMLPVGSACGVWNQCESGRCLQPDDGPQGGCGKCVAQQQFGEQCRLNACRAGFSCRGTNDTNRICTKYASEGESCDPDPDGPGPRTSPRPCHDYLVCDGGKCSRLLGACEPSVGCPVIPQLYYCDASDGGPKTCQPFAPAKLGDACGYVAGAPIAAVRCVYGSACTLVPATDAGSDAVAPLYEMCTTPIDDGKPCTGRDSECKTPDSYCFRDLCQQHGAAQCTAPPVLP